MSEYERESPTIHSESPEDFSNHTFLEGKKKIIKKEKKSSTPVAAAKLSKEERMRIQKEKNREAAQRSRDQHKEYVNKL
jgi:hemerythrin-like domain-containing protein